MPDRPGQDTGFKAQPVLSAAVTTYFGPDIPIEKNALNAARYLVNLATKSVHGEPVEP